MKRDKDLCYQSATALVAALARKEISSVELVEKTIARIEKRDQKINAVVVRDFERARIAAKAADKAIARGEQLPLLGLPMTVKESFNVAGLPTTWGNPVYKDWCPDDDALAVARLKKAGAIIIGKTNVPFMLQDWQTYNEIYGTTNNPWNLKLTPGGSSGGSAAALAAGFVSLELGSDLAGSIRVPSNFCGVFGHKPSVHLVPLRGSTPPTTVPTPNPLIDLVVAGPMARTATDLALALDVLAGPDELWDGKGYKLSLPPARHQNLRNFRVLVMDQHPFCPTATGVRHVIDSLAERLTKAGVTVSRDREAVPDLAEITRTYFAMLGAFIGANMPMEEYQKLAAEAKKLSADDRGISASIVRGVSINYRDWFAASRLREKLRRQWRSLFKEFDVIICPVMPTPAFPHDHSANEKRKIEIDGTFFSYQAQFAWPSIASLFGLPATVAPVGLTEKGLPVGVQLIGDYLEDYTTIKLAGLIEQELGLTNLISRHSPEA